MQALVLQGVSASRSWRLVARLWEILPGLAAWLFLFSPLILSWFEPMWVAYIIIGYDLLWLTRAVGMSYRLVRGYRRLRRTTRADWQHRLNDLEDVPTAIERVARRLHHETMSRGKQLELKRYLRNLQQLVKEGREILKPSELYQAVIVATYNESLDTLEPTIQSVIASHYDRQRVWLIIAYEERGGEQTQHNAEQLIKRYGRRFGYAAAIKHPANLPGEAVAKAGNINYAARLLTQRIRTQGIDPTNVLVTTLDADNRPAPQYFAHLSFIYATTPNRIHKSYQPIPMFLNNIWDAPAPMRILATGSSFWIMMEAMRPHRLRNFSAHAQCLQTLIDTDYWNPRSIVEDGHQFWRTYYRYEGDHEAIPLFVPIYQDAVLAGTYWQSLRAQFVQFRRWAWGVSDVSYVFINNLKHKHIPRADKWMKFFRLLEGNFTWATASLILALAAWMPLLLNADFAGTVIAHQLPIIASRIQTLALFGVIITAFIGLVILPPRPARYRSHRRVLMVAQWVLLPFATIFIHSMAALNAQTRLLFGRYLEKFDVTVKAVVDPKSGRLFGNTQDVAERSQRRRVSNR